MHFPRPTRARFATAAKAGIFIATLSATTLFPMLSNPNTIRADAGCSPNGVFLSGTDPSWLNGTAVNVCNNGGVSTNDYGASCFTKTGGSGGAGCPSGTVYAGEEWQCVELVNRLYLAKGWISGTWTGNGNTLINNLPASLTDQLNGHITYVSAGDVITLDDGGFGHAAIVNTVGSNSSLNIVNQNTTQSNLYSSATLSNGTSLSAGTAFYNSSWFGYTVQAIVHHPSTSTPQMLLDAQNNVWAKSSIGSGGWTEETTSANQVAISAGGGTQMSLDTSGDVWAKSTSAIALNGWTEEVIGGIKAIATGDNGFQMLLDTSGNVYARNNIGTSGWTEEINSANQVAISAGGGTQMSLDTSGDVWAKSTSAIALNGWTEEVTTGITSISAGDGGLQVILDTSGNVWAKSSIGSGGWTEEVTGGTQAIAAG